MGTSVQPTHGLLQALVESAPDALIVVGQGGGIRLVNAQAERLFGYPRAELLGQRIETLIPERFRDRHAGHRDGFFRAPKVREMGAGLELYGRRRDGSEFPVEISLSPIDSPDGLLVSAAIRDITDRKKADAARMRLAAIVESSNDAIVGRDMANTITSWNRGAERMFGWTAEEAVGKPVSILLPPGEADAEERMMERLRLGDPVEHIEARRVHKGGRPVAVSLSLSPILDHQGRLVGAAKIMRDITERQRAAATFRGLLESAPDAMVIVDRGGRITLINAQTERLFGYTRHELLGQKVEVLIPERYKGSHPDHRGRFFESPKTRAMGAGLDLYGRRKDGTEFPVEISLSPIETEDGVLASSAIRDVSQRKQSEAELERTTKEVRAANEELEAFAYSVSHDLRAPLRSMSGFAQILRDDHAEGMSPEARHALDMIVESAREMSSLIDDLLAFSRLARQPLAADTVDVAALATQVVQEQDLQGRSVRFQVDALPPASADAKLLRHVLANLVSNAVKYTRGQDPAHVHVGWDATQQAYFVKDDGVGFDMKHAGKLFGVFQRLHRAEEYEGTGVGLAIVQRIVLRHGGQAWAHGEVGRGATFWFTLGARHA